MNLSRIAVHSRVDSSLALRDPGPLIGLIAMPLLLVGFLWRGYTALLPDLAATPDASGVAVATPGFTVMFVFFVPGFLALSIMREHSWGTWSRIRLSEATPLEVVLGKSLPYFAVALVQVGLLYGFGTVVLDLELTGSVVAYVVLAVVVAFVAVAFGWMIVSICRTSQQAMTLGNLGGITLAGLGGALQPVHVLPGWVQALSPFTPHYWAVDGFQQVILDGAGLGEVLGQLAILLAFAVGALAVFLVTYRPVDAKISYL